MSIVSNEEVSRMMIAEVCKKYGLSQDTLRYYEKEGLIPHVHRNKSGIRDYSDDDCAWIELAKCMRGAGLPVEVVAEYRRLFLEGDGTIAARRDLLVKQREELLAQKQAIDEMLDRLNYKISRYNKAVETGVLTWE